ncbi:suppressor APC domain-containing protein 1 isoform X2 [Bombina bombina]|uniref:suppressor APC domain-containing protein 1 isoform X2 n=1 Tax=Bombina bombina TaxID=8345 RepID=UPI00235AD1A4|nr:suppressor APC domain-containing protein 1 isoform X2 [Bombina bombina]
MVLMAVPAAYTIIIVPLYSSREALTFYMWLRRMKELEQERDALLDGVQLVDRAQEWYKERLHEAEKQRELRCSKGVRRQPSFNSRHSDILTSLKHQNKQLTRELSAQNERIWKLQRENEALYRELQERQIHRATFI